MHVLQLFSLSSSQRSYGGLWPKREMFSCVTGGWQICILFVGDMKKKLMQHVRFLRDYSYLHGNQNE